MDKVQTMDKVQSTIRLTLIHHRQNPTEIIYYCYLHHHHALSQVSFPLVLLLLNQWCTPPLRLQVSDCSTFLFMCDAPSTAVLYTEPVESFPGIVSRSSLVP